jgi:NAD+ synthase
MLPEKFVTAYQTQGFVTKSAFHEDAMRHVEALAREIGEGPHPHHRRVVEGGDKLYNAYHAIPQGSVVSRKLKTERPHYNVFDEARVFASGPLEGPSTRGRSA